MFGLPTGKPLIAAHAYSPKIKCFIIMCLLRPADENYDRSNAHLQEDALMLASAEENREETDS